MAVFCFYGDFCQVLNVLNATLKSDSCVINLKALPAVVSSLTALMKIFPFPTHCCHIGEKLRAGCFKVCMHAYMCACVRVYMCLCVRARARMCVCDKI